MVYVQRQMTMKKYELIKDMGTYCPFCNQMAWLLCPDILEAGSKNLPAFYICWNCKHIAQVGVGTVEEKEEVE